jgi:hypothetical protein
LCSEICHFINSICNKEELPQQWKESTSIPIYKEGNKSVVIIEGYHYYSVDFKVTDQLLLRYSAFVRYWRRNGNTVGLYISYL